MTTTMIPDDELLGAADVVTVWVASPDAPHDVWSLAEAVAWVMRQPGRQKITLFRPADQGARAAGVKPDQIERLASALTPELASTAA
jgi:hypothetical protein